MTALKFWIVCAMLILTFNGKKAILVVFCSFVFFLFCFQESVISYQNYFFSPFSMTEALTLMPFQKKTTSSIKGGYFSQLLEKHMFIQEEFMRS